MGTAFPLTSCSVDSRRNEGFDIPNWNVKGDGPRWQTDCALRIHGAGRRDAFQRAQDTDRAVKVNVAIMRVFVRLRAVLASDRNLARRMDTLEKNLKDQGATIGQVFRSIRQLMTPVRTSRKIGF
jgi:hypothetical protein